ncbi:MAG: hypothetical protein DYG88_03585 [Chloroflexi bacterium CFX4]|nr:hypothetical protein [Chloroflexi bacterium CFX4]MDL1921149.1 hypothetical protein [Chloroflexi bacterium CFX3]
MNQYPILNTLKGLLQIVGYAVLVIGFFGSFASASSPAVGRDNLDVWLLILQLVFVLAIGLPLLILAELVTLFQDVARNLSMARFAAEDISKRVDALHEIEARRERTRT